MERVLDHFDLLLDRDADGDHPGGRSDRSSRGGLPGKEAGAVKERIARALRLYKEAAEERGGGGALVQVWAPARDGDRRVLATRGQPFVLASQCHRLFQYRTISLTHVFPVGGAGAAGEHGLPGRVFDSRAPEWTPNVQYYSSSEYARISYALIYDIQGSLALPILDPDTRCCLAVLELVMTAPMIRFAGEVDKLCKALQAVALRGSEICHPAVEICNSEAIQLAMSEVSEILTSICEAHKLPLAQAWVRCKCCNPDTRCTAVDSCSTEHFSLTSAGAPFYLTDAGVCGFREACVEHHLQRGQGLVGKAAATRSPCFCADVTKCSKDAYPLAHYARLYGLVGCLVICLQLQSDVSMKSGQEEYVLELFLPPDRRSVTEQKAALGAISAMARECFGNLKAIAITNLQDLSLEIVADGDHCVLRPDHVVIADTPELDDGHKDSDEDVHLAVDSTNVEAVNVLNGGQIRSKHPRSQLGRKKVRRGKAGKSVSLEELQRYFSGSLKDAARNLGVCPTTMKRICRQHGISKWPFRTINKVNHSLDKIKRVVESVNCPAKPITAASSSQPAPVPPRHLPCLSSQGSYQAPPLTSTASRKPLQRSSNGVGGVVTVKASYRGDIVRFRVPCSAGVAAVKEEVAKRLGLEVGAFDVKYLDDDHEWVLLSCDDDFQECLDVVAALPVAAASGSGTAAQVVRLMVQEVADSLGSSDQVGHFLAMHRSQFEISESMLLSCDDDFPECLDLQLLMNQELGCFCSSKKNSMQFCMQ